MKLELHPDDRPPIELTLDEYLRSSFSPDCDFVDGHSEERNVGILSHSLAVMGFMSYMHSRREAWNAEVLPSLRLRVSPTRVRVADLCLLSLDAPREQIPTHPPILVIEILDEEDRVCATLEKLNDYLRFGVRGVWLADPETRRVWGALDGGLHFVDGDELVGPNTRIRIPLSEAFAELDRA